MHTEEQFLLDHTYSVQQDLAGISGAVKKPGVVQPHRCELRHIDPDDLAIIVRGQAQVGSHDGLLNDVHGPLVEGCNHQQA